MVGASFTVAAVAQVLRSKKGITAVGNAQVDTAQSQFGGASFQSDGAGDYLQIAPSSDFAFTGDFTVECWLRFSAHEQYGGIFSCSNPGSTQSAGYQVIFNDTNNSLYVGIDAGSFTSSTSLSTNTWHHIALVRNSGVFTLYLNGTANGTLSNSNTMDCSTHNFYWGTERTAGQEVTGHFDEMRVSNSARYTTTFTPSTTPFVNDANTVLLIHANGTDASTFFEDDNGTVRSQNNGRRFSAANISTTRSKFGGSSIYFDGVDDRVTLSNPITRADNQDFTFEFWVNEDFVQNCKYIGGQIQNDIFIGHDTAVFSNRLGMGIVGVGWYMDFGVTLAADTWYHICVQRSGDTVYGYTNGTLRVTHTSTFSNWDFHWRNMVLGAEGEGNTPMNGYLDEIRLSSNVRYTTSGFTAPTEPFVNDANTLLLIHGDGTNGSTVFRDDNGSRIQQGLISGGSAAISTTQSKFGGSSLYFNGTSQFLTSPGASNTAFTTGDFTVECWIYPISSVGNFITNLDVNTNNGWSFSHWNLGRILWTSANAAGNNIDVIFSSENAFSLNTWSHLAVCRTGSTMTMYANGNRVYSDNSFATIKASTTGLKIGHSFGISSGTYSDPGAYSNSYSNELRISNIVRYTGTTYTIPTTPFQNDANTLFLLHANGTNGSTVFFDDNGIAPYTP
jgi:hypothetical protein